MTSMVPAGPVLFATVPYGAVWDADHQVTRVRTTTLAGGVTDECPGMGDDIDDLSGNADAEKVAGVADGLAQVAVPTSAARKVWSGSTRGPGRPWLRADEVGTATWARP